MIHIFVYGTLKPGFAAYDRLCKASVIATQPAMARGRLYYLPQGYPAMTAQEGRVSGILLTFADNKILPILDDYEDDGYVRSKLTVQLVDDRNEASIEAWCYLMSPQQITHWNGQWVKSGQWPEMDDETA